MAYKLPIVTHSQLIFRGVPIYRAIFDRRLSEKYFIEFCSERSGCCCWRSWECTCSRWGLGLSRLVGRVSDDPVAADAIGLNSLYLHQCIVEHAPFDPWHAYLCRVAHHRGLGRRRLGISSFGLGIERSVSTHSRLQALIILLTLHSAHTASRMYTQFWQLCVKKNLQRNL